MSFVLGKKSRERLQGVHPDLVRVVEHAITLTPVDFVVLEGLRTPERQKQLMASGASMTLNSRHLTGHAVDLGALVDGEIRWDWPIYTRIAESMKASAASLSVKLTWGGDWRRFRDGPHFELDRKAYP